MTVRVGYNFAPNYSPHLRGALPCYGKRPPRWNREGSAFRYSDATFNIVTLFIPKPASDKMIKCVEFQYKGKIAAIAEQRHFEDVVPVAPRDVIDPLRVRIVIPHLPEEGCQQNTEPQRNDGTPIAFLSPLGERTIPKPEVDRFENKVEGQPDKAEEKLRKDQKQCEHDPAQSEERDGCFFICTNDEASAKSFDEAETGEEFRTPKHRRDDRGETQRRPKEISKGRKDLCADVRPVLGAEIEQFEDPPHRRRDEEQTDVFARTTREQ